MHSETVKSLITRIIKELSDIYSLRESESLAWLTLSFVTNTPVMQLRLHTVANVPKTKVKKIEKILFLLKKNVPVQYIFGETEFRGHKFKVTPAVLIPRPETEELVELIISDMGYNKNDISAPSGLRIMDMGTGSGCIAVSLACECRNTDVYALDISRRALNIAAKNIELNNCKVNLYNADIIKLARYSKDSHHGYSELYCEADKKFDIIVSNPPYISQEQKTAMLPNVLEHEPLKALFPPGKDPLLFYCCISVLGKKWLVQGGRLYFELNEDYAEQTADLMCSDGYSNVNLHRDINGKYRFLSCILPSQENNINSNNHSK